MLKALILFSVDAVQDVSRFRIFIYSKLNDFVKVGVRRQRKKIQMQGAQILRNEA
jgi:hypothetical protein